MTFIAAGLICLCVLCMIIFIIIVVVLRPDGSRVRMTQLTFRRAIHFFYMAVMTDSFQRFVVDLIKQLKCFFILDIWESVLCL